tara:strand:- start:803 stop:3466 length:2664 start_codon:yes stop_codon:yes gene_type:complete
MGTLLEQVRKNEEGFASDAQRRAAFAQGYKAKGKKKEEELDIQEDGHTDVASAIRQCKTILEDSMQVLQKLKGMNPEESLPSWWTNKLAVSSNSMNKLRDYFLVPTTEEVELDEAFKPDQVKAAVAIARDSRFSMKQMVDKKTAIEKIAKGLSKDPAVKKVLDKVYEEFDLNEKAGDIPDLKNLVGELVKASGMHLAQSKRVQAHVDMMVKADAKGPEGAGGLADLKKIVGELEKASEAHKRQSKSIDAHVKFMGEEINEKFTKKDFKDNEDSNHHTENGVEIVNMFGTSAEKVKMAGIAARHNMKGGISRKDQQDRDALVKKYYSKLESVNEMSYKPGSFKSTKPQEKGAKAFDNFITQAKRYDDLDLKDYQKARALYVQASDPASREKLKKFIFNLDTEPKELVMNLIGVNDPQTFLQMYPNAKKGQPLTTVSFAHRNMKSEEVLPGHTVQSVEYKFKDKNEAMKAKKVLLKYFNSVDDEDINRGVIIVDAGRRDMNKEHEEIMKKFRPKVLSGRKIDRKGNVLDMKEEVELDEMDMKFVLINMQNKIQGFTSNEKDAKEISRRTKSTIHPIKKKISDKTLEKMNALARSPKELRDLGIIEQLAEAKDIKILVKDVKDRNFLKDLLNKAKDEKVMVGSPTPADKKAGRYTFVGPKDKVNNVFNYAFDKSINRGNYAPATMMHEGASEMLDEISRANANKVNSELSKILGKIRFTHFYQMGPKAIFKLPKNVKHEVVVNRNDMKDAADLLMKDKGDVGFMFKQGQLRLAKAMDSNVVEENELINKAAGYISHMQMAERIDPADIDDTASEKDIENAAKNIIMQLRKSVSMRGNKDVEFADGKKKVDMRIAQKAIDMHMRMKPQDKLKFQNKIATSYKSLLNAIKGK